MRMGLSILVVVLAAWAGISVAAPSPSVVPKSWEVEFTFHDPQRISVVLPGDRGATVFWYILYTVTNNTGQEIGFYPTFDLVTDKLEVIEGGYGISPSVYAAINAQHKKVYRFFIDPMEMYGPLRQGEDNARTSAIAFGQLDEMVNSFKIYVGGLSGEIVKVRNTRFDRERPESQENARFFALRKTLSIAYHLPGDRRTQRETVPARSEIEWVMR